MKKVKNEGKRKEKREARQRKWKATCERLKEYSE